MIKVLDESTSGTNGYVEYNPDKHAGLPFKEIKFGVFRQQNYRVQKNVLAKSYNRMIKVLDEPTSGTKGYVEYNPDRHLGKPFKEIRYGAFRQQNYRVQNNVLARESHPSSDMTVIDESTSELSPKANSYTQITSTLIVSSVSNDTAKPDDALPTPAPKKRSVASLMTDETPDIQVLADFLTHELNNAEEKRKRRDGLTVNDQAENLSPGIVKTS
jgi:hypothetical protein